MTIFVEYNDFNEEWEVSQNGGMGTLTTRSTRDSAVTAARKFSERGEDIAINGPRMSGFKQL